MLEIGSLVDGKYKILNKVGQGGMSVVYLAMNEKANKQWAVKEVRKDGVLDFEFDGDETPIDVTDDIPDVIVYNKVDGFYHYGSSTGPIIVLNLVDNDYTNFNAALVNGGFRIPHYEADGTTVYTGDEVFIILKQPRQGCTVSTYVKIAGFF